MRQGLIALLLALGLVLALSPSMAAQASTQSGAVQITNGPIIETADSNSAMIAWSTNQPSSSRVWYGTDANNLTQQAESPYATGTTHRVQLKNLQPNTTYYFQVESARGQSGPEAESQGVMSFKTPAQGQPTIHNQPAQVAEKGAPGGDENGKVKITSAPVLEEVTSNSATVAWSTNVKGSSRVTYGTDPNNLTQLGESPWGQGGLTHRVQLKNLQPNTTYYFRVETGQAAGTGGAEVEGNKVMSFKTPAPGAPPVKNEKPQ
jgi:phosphodiesterase/alkaline phosphatase D-like protein